MRLGVLLGLLKPKEVGLLCTFEVSLKLLKVKRFGNEVRGLGNSKPVLLHEVVDNLAVSH